MTRKVDRLTMRPSTAVVRIAPTAIQLYGYPSSVPSPYLQHGFPHACTAAVLLHMHGQPQARHA